jgi:hypothetical protein
LRGDREWPLVAIFHLIVLTGLGLVASGASVFKGVDVKPINSTLLKIGIIILLLTWVVLCVWSLFSLLPSQRTVDAPGFVGGTKACQVFPNIYKYQVLLTFNSDTLCCPILSALRWHPNALQCPFDPCSVEKPQS